MAELGFRRVLGAMILAFTLVMAGAALGTNLAQAQESGQQNSAEAASDSEAPVGGRVPGNTLGAASDADLWRAVRGGIEGNVSIPNKQAGVMIQSEGESWRSFRNGPLSTYGVWVLAGMVALLALFFLLRGRVKIESGPSGRTVERFNLIERTVHWITAVSFIILALTGLNVLYGRYIVAALVGRGEGALPGSSGFETIYATLTIWGKYAHNYLAFPFMLGVALMFVIWVRHNIPNRHDIVWLAKGGGLFSKHSHPPAKKFNAGQKIIFWAVVLGGVSLSLSGISLLFPFQTDFFAKTFEFMNIFGAGLPADLTLMQEMQLSQAWHSIVGLVMIAIILAHIYIGSLGMEGAFDAMGTGQVDLNWAREHHSLWTEEITKKGSGEGRSPQPAE